MSDAMKKEDNFIPQSDTNSLLKSYSIEDPKEKNQAMRTILWMI